MFCESALDTRTTRRSSYTNRHLCISQAQRPRAQTHLSPSPSRAQKGSALAKGERGFATTPKQNRSHQAIRRSARPQLSPLRRGCAARLATRPIDGSRRQAQQRMRARSRKCTHNKRCRGGRARTRGSRVGLTSSTRDRSPLVHARPILRISRAISLPLRGGGCSIWKVSTRPQLSTRHVEGAMSSHWAREEDVRISAFTMKWLLSHTMYTL